MEMIDAAGALGKVADGARGPVGAPDILGAGQRVIAGMRSTTGHGRPDAGEAFARGASGFFGAVRAVDGAYPREWDGPAAESYTEVTRRLAMATEALAVLDRHVHTVIDREATQIIRRRETLDDQADHLSSLRRVTGSLAGIPGVGSAMTSAIQMAAVTAAVGVCETELCDLAAETADNASRLHRLAGDYEALNDAPAPADEAVPTDDAHGEELPKEDAPVDDLPVEEVVEPSAAASAPVTSTCPAPAPTTAGEQSPMQGDPMSGLTSAFGAVGGMIGAAVAPLAAVVSGVVTAAGQLPSLASQASSPQVDAPDDEKDVVKDVEETADPDDPAQPEIEPVDAAGAAPPETPAPPERAPNPPPSQPAPAATRPPQ